MARATAISSFKGSVIVRRIRATTNKDASQEKTITAATIPA